MSNESLSSLSRRSLLGGVAGAAVGAATLQDLEAAKVKRVVKNDRINQSIVQWCFSKYWKLEETCAIAAKLGCKSVELVGIEDFATLKKHGLVCAIATSWYADGPPFVKGLNDPKNHDMCLDFLKRSIDGCAAANFPSTITFTGFAGEISPEDGIKNCVTALKKIAGYAEKKKVTINLEMLNTRDDSDPMKGHPGYQGDHIDYCMEIMRGVSSPRVKLLFDIYHVQIMDGDVIRRIHECKDYIGHIHTAGNPGRGELDDNQEINYPPIMKALLDIGYTGYVGQEFIPTRDPLQGLQEAVALCDV